MVKKKKGKKEKNWLKQKAISRRISKGNKITVVQSSQPPAPYIPIYMKEQIEEDKRNFFFK
jgi:hypothetical protein